MTRLAILTLALVTLFPAVSGGTRTGTTNRYDAQQRLTNLVWALNGSLRAGFGYTLGPAGNRLSLVETNDGTTRTFTWGYDDTYRLTSEALSRGSPAGTLNYTYDAVGNRKTRNAALGLSLQTLNFDVRDQVDNNATPSSLSTYFDANGNTVSLEGTWAYDWANRLINYNSGAVVLTYDAEGHRTKKVAGTTTHYLVATVNPTGWPQVVEEHTGASPGTVSRRYTHGLDRISQWQSPGNATHFYLSDGLGSVRALLNTAGGLTDTYTYDAYGNLIASSTPTDNAYRFTGEQWDADLGQYYLRARYLHPGYGRFWTRDSYEGSQSDPLSLHAYLYAHVNPVNSTDPSGHFTEGLGGLLSASSLQFGLKSSQGTTIVVSGHIAARGLMKWAWLSSGIGAGVWSMIGDTSFGMDIQVSLKENPTGSRWAYVNERCTDFANDAGTYFASRGQSPQRITYDSKRPNTREGFINAKHGFGFFGVNGINPISSNGHHEGILVNGRVFDNNVPFGVPRTLWEEGYKVSILGVGEMSIGESHRRGYGIIKP